MTIATGDLNGDGATDLVTSNYKQDGAVPGSVSVLLGQVGGASFTGVADGTWYFHVRADGAAGWGSTSTVQVNIDTTPPVTTASGLSNTSPGWDNSDTVSLSGDR